MINTALINSWVIYKKVCQSKINRREYLQKVAEQLTRFMTSDSRIRTRNDCGSTRPITSPITVEQVRRTSSRLPCCAKIEQPILVKNATNQCVNGVLKRNANFVTKYTALSKHADKKAVVLRSNCCFSSNTHINPVDWYRFYKHSHRV